MLCLLRLFEILNLFLMIISVFNNVNVISEVILLIFVFFKDVGDDMLEFLGLYYLIFFKDINKLEENVSNFLIFFIIVFSCDVKNFCYWDLVMMLVELVGKSFCCIMMSNLVCILEIFLIIKIIFMESVFFGKEGKYCC